MAIARTTIRIYSDINLSDLVQQETVSGSTQEATITGLSAGTEYYATAQSTDDQSQTGEVSAPYRFYTVPNVVFTGTPIITANSVEYDISTTTSDVNVQSVGIVYDTNSSFNNPTFVDGNRIVDLRENETYYLRPFVVDEFNRQYINESDTQSISTSYSLPVVDWVSIIDITDTNFNAVINVQSSTSLLAVEAVYQRTGEERQSVQLDPVVGEQTINISELTPESEYTISVRATNDYGFGDSVPFTFNTLSNANI